MNQNTKTYITFVLLVISLLVLYMLLTDVENKDESTSHHQSEISKNTEIQKNNSIVEKTDLSEKTYREIESENSDYLLILILGLTTLVSVSTSFWLYRWRRTIIAGNDIVVPESFANQVNSIVSSLNVNSSKVEKTASQQSSIANGFNNSLSILSNNIQNMIDTYMSLQSSLDKKDNEIERYKKGYDAEIFENFLLRFSKVDRVIKEYIDDGEIDINGLKDIQEVMEDALDECGVESFSPLTGEDYRNSEGVADNPKKVITNDQSNNFLIKDVVQPGYRRRLPDSSFEVIAQAKVVVYIYQDSKDLNEIEKKEQE